MRFALVNPNWSFEGSTYFGCREPHYPLELLFAYDQIERAGHEALLLDAQLEGLGIADARSRLQQFDAVVADVSPAVLGERPNLNLRLQAE